MLWSLACSLLTSWSPVPLFGTPKCGQCHSASRIKPTIQSSLCSSPNMPSWHCHLVLTSLKHSTRQMFFCVTVHAIHPSWIPSFPSPHLKHLMLPPPTSFQFTSLKMVLPVCMAPAYNLHSTVVDNCHLSCIIIYFKYSCIIIMYYYSNINSFLSQRNC